MKKKTFTMLFVVVMMTALLAGCGSSSTSTSSSTPAKTTASTSSTTTEKKAEEPKKEEAKPEVEEKKEAEDDGKTVDDWVNDSMNQALVSSMSNSEMDIFLIAADAKTVSFQFQFKTQVPLDDIDQADIDAMFDEQIDAQEDVFTDMRDSLVDDTKIDDVVLRIEYLNADGSVIYTRDFTK